jgi:TorA maturation chaperone TorD
MTQMIAEEREQTLFRQNYYGLLVRLVSAEPTAELLQVLRSGSADRAEAARALHPLLGDAWDYLDKLLSKLSVGAAEQEFLKLFIGPFQPEMNAYESWYLTGQLFQAPLISVRGFLSQVGLQRKEAEYPEPEDSIGFELEIMNWLVTRQLASSSAEEEREWLHRQTAFLTQHILLWGPKFSEDLEAAKDATLYKGVALMLRGLLAMERQRLQSHGVTEFETLEQARKRYGTPRPFRGPLFDPAAPASKTGSTPPPGDKG